MDYYRATEKYLYNYKSLKANIENMKAQIKEMDYNSLQGAGFEYIEDTGYKKSTVENTVIRIDKKRNDLKNRIKELECKLERIDRSIEVLNEIEREIVKGWYFEGRQWWQIAHKVKYSERHCRRIKANAVNKISVGLFGLKVVEEMMS